MSQLIMIVLLGVLIPVLMRWMQKDALAESETSKDGNELVMRPSKKHHILVFGLIALAAGFGLLVVTFEYPEWKSGVAVGMFLLSFTAPYALTLRRRVRVDDRGLRAFSPFGTQLALPWSSVEAVSFREWGQTIRIRGANGGTIVVPLYMTGLDVLERFLVERAPETAREGGAFEKLRNYLATL